MRPSALPVSKLLIPLLVVALAASVERAAEAAAAGRPRIVDAAAPGRIELPSGRQVSLALPAGAALAAIEPLAGGWIVAGTRRVEAPAGDGREIFLLAGRGDGRAISLPAPPRSGRLALLRAEPLPLVENGRLAGLVWLEGQEARRFAVRFARWDGAAWKAPRDVSPPGPGSQLALAAARLADGSWLLAWSAFDGRDDEILWSRLEGGQWSRLDSGRSGRLDGGQWSRPARVAADNDVPDITPALTAMGDGALLAWSRFDGDGYRVVTARFSPGEDRFSPPRPIAPAGTVFPSFEPAPATAGGAWLLARSAAPRGWSLFELDADGRPLRQAAIAAATSIPQAERPVVAGEPGGGVAFRFPASGARRTAAWERSPGDEP